MPLCANCGEDNPSRARFCLACGSPLEGASEPPPMEERRMITVLFTDIVGSTATAERLDPEDVRARLAPYYERVRHELEAFGGTVEKFIGDAVVGLFGAPVVHEDDPERAVRAALAVRDAIAELNEDDEWLDLNIRTGVHTGEALVVLGARASEGEGMATGDVMNTAARLQSGAPVNGIIVGEATHRATAHAVDYREAEPVQAKGKAEPIRVWEVIGALEQPSRRTISKALLVGREDELQGLANAWVRLRNERRPLAALVLGAPGIGKSRLLAEFVDRISTVAGVYQGRCLAYGEGITYWPIMGIVRGAAGVLHDDGPAAVSRKLGALLRRLPTDEPDELRTVAAALANLSGVETTPEGTYAAAEITQAELHWGIRRLLTLLAASRPLVLVVEDLHWAEETLLELLDSIVADAEGPILVIGSARPELAEAHPAFAASDERRLVVELSALGEAESRALLAELVGVEQIPEGPLATLLANAGGNPLFLEETVGVLKDAGLVADGVFVGDVGALSIPNNLKALIGSRLDQLPAGAKRVVQHAAVAGMTFWSGALAQLDGVAEELGSALDALERRDFIRAHEGSTLAGEKEFSFKHALIRDVAYEQLPKGHRAGLHLRFANWVSALPAGEDELVEIVAFHLEQSCRLAGEVARSPVAPPIREAVRALGQAAAKSERREGFREAERFYARALDVAGNDDSELLAETSVRHASALMALGELSKAGHEFARVAEEASRLGRRDLRSAALVELGDIDLRQGRAADARQRLTEAGELAAELGNPILRVRAAFVLAELRAEFDGAFEEAVEDLRRSVLIAEDIDDRSLRAEGLLRTAALLFNLGRFAEAEEQLSRCLEIAREMGSHRVEAEATSWLGIVKNYRGEFEEARRLALQAREWLERTSDSYFRVQNLVRLAMYALADDDARLAEERLQEAVPIALGIEGWVVVESYRFLVEALVRQGRLEDARQLADFAARSVTDEDPYARATVAVARGIFAAAEGDARTARRAFEEALHVLDELHMPVDVAEARVTFAHVLAQVGESEESRAELERARELFTAMGASGAVAQIERELTQLDPARLSS